MCSTPRVLIRALLTPWTLLSLTGLCENRSPTPHRDFSVFSGRKKPEDKIQFFQFSAWVKTRGLRLNCKDRPPKTTSFGISVKASLPHDLLRVDSRDFHVVLAHHVFQMSPEEQTLPNMQRSSHECANPYFLFLFPENPNRLRLVSQSQQGNVLQCF